MRLITSLTHAKRTSQKGVVLLITLIMLVAMTLAAIALARSVDTSNLVAGNLAFQQTSVNIADAGVEQAIGYLYATVSNNQLIKCTNVKQAGIPDCPSGYKSFHEEALEPASPPNGLTWDDYWNSMKQTIKTIPFNLPNMPSGYSGEFVIEKLCQGSDPATQVCTPVLIKPTIVANAAEGQNVGDSSIPRDQKLTPAHYFRVTTQVKGPRNSTAYIQTLIFAYDR